MQIHEIRPPLMVGLRLYGTVHTLQAERSDRGCDTAKTTAEISPFLPFSLVWLLFQGKRKANMGVDDERGWGEAAMGMD